MVDGLCSSQFCSALLHCSWNKTTLFPQKTNCLIRHTSTTVLRYFCYRDTVKLMILLHPCQQLFICVCFSFMMTRFIHNWIFKNFMNCAWISTDLCGWNIFHLEKKVAERRNDVLLQHSMYASDINPAHQVRVQSATENKIRSRGTVPKCTEL